MPSSYSPNLRLELIASGEQANTWGNTTNTNLGTLIEQAITGNYNVDVSSGSQTLTTLNGASDQARCAMITAVGTPTGTTSIYCPNGISKTYVFNNLTAQPVTFSTVSGTGVTVQAGGAQLLFCNGTNVYSATTSAYTPNYALQTNNVGQVEASPITSTQLGYLSDVTSNIGAGKQATITAAGILYGNGTSVGAANLVGLNWNSVTNTLTVTGTAGVTSLTASSPLTANGTSGTPQTGTVTVAMPQANTSNSGWLSSTDWNTFNNKVSTSGTGATGTWGISITGNAATATTASSASSATNATNASYATSAGTATSATNASYATSAGSASSASTAGVANALNTANTYTVTGLTVDPSATTPVYIGSVAASGGGIKCQAYNMATESSIYWVAGTGVGLAVSQTDGSTPYFYNFGYNGTATAANWVSTSDQSLKENIEAIPTPLESINAVNPVQFSYKTDKLSAPNHYGVIAQELETILPNLVGEVTYDKGPNAGQAIKTVSYSELIPILIGAIQELQAKLKAAGVAGF